MNTTAHTAKNRRFRTALRHVWQDQVAANTALLRINPADEKPARHL